MVALFVLLMGAALLWAKPAHAATKWVTNTLDSGVGSLRNQLAGTSAGDTIAFSVTGVITINRELSITHSVIISGRGMDLLTINGNDASRVFTVANNIPAQIKNLTIANGSADTGAGIQNAGVLTVTGVRFINNKATGTGFGGGILNDGRLIIINAIFSGNNASKYGGAVFNQRILTLTSSTLVGNSAYYGGGGVFNVIPGMVSEGSANGVSGLSIISDCNVLTNTTTAGYWDAGGGIFNYYGAMTVMGGLVAYNSALRGGGLYNFYGSVSVNNASITDNAATLSPGNSPGGGGGIFSSGYVTLVNTLVARNTANSGGGIFHYDGGQLRLISSTIDSNSSGGISINTQSQLVLISSTISNNGGGIRADHVQMWIDGSAIHNNTSYDGSGIWMFSSALTMTNSSVYSNHGSGDGGGISSVMSILLINTSTIYSNTTTGWGGGIASQMGYYRGALTITQSTIAGNHADGGGGGIYAGYGDALLNYDTIVRNTTGGSGGGLVVNVGAAVVTGAIIAESTGGDCSGSVQSIGHNLDSDATCSFTATTDISNTPPILGPLQNNGGYTLTSIPLPGSPAIDAGGNTCPAKDQRGKSRPQNHACDIGAVEALMKYGLLPTVIR